MIKGILEQTHFKNARKSIANHRRRLVCKMIHIYTDSNNSILITHTLKAKNYDCVF